MTVTPIGRFCEANIPASPGVMIVCGIAAAGVWDYGCIHEHVRLDMATCAEHAPRAGVVGCFRCLQLGHDCEMTFRPAQTEPRQPCTE